MVSLKKKISLLEEGHHSNKRVTDESIHNDQRSNSSEEETKDIVAVEPSGREEGTQALEEQSPKISEIEVLVKREMEGDQINASLEDEHNKENYVEDEQPLESSHNKQHWTRSSLDDSEASVRQNSGSSNLSGKPLKTRYASRKRYTPYIEYTKLAFKVLSFYASLTTSWIIILVSAPDCSVFYLDTG